MQATGQSQQVQRPQRDAEPARRCLVYWALGGAATLSAFSILQKIILHANPFVPEGFIVPVLFGGAAGFSLGLARRRERLRILAHQDAWSRAMEETAERERRFRLLAENARDTVFRWLIAEQRYDYVSPSVFDLTGYPAAEFTERGTLFFELVHPDDRDGIAEIQQTISAGSIAPVSEYRLIHRDGRTIHANQRHVLTTSQEGFPLALEGIVTDVTAERVAQDEARRLQEQLRQNQKLEAIGRLAGGVAHDFNNLLTAITGYTEMAIDDARSGRDVEEQLAMVLTASERAANLTSQLLAFSRKQDLRTELVDPGVLLHESIGLLLGLLGEDIEVVFETEEPLPRVAIDPRQLEQALLNLAINARDAMPEGGTLRLHAGHRDLVEAKCDRCNEPLTGEFVAIEVSDTGMGIPPEIQDSIFDPFFTTKETGKGTGLGLSTVFGIVHQHQGHVQVESEPGGGSLFRLLLPASGEEALIAPPKVETATGSLNGSERILLVEDEALVRNLTEKYLQQFGYRIETAANGVEAIEVWKRNEGAFDLLLTDVIMPEMKGPRLAEQLTGEKPSLQVIYMSGYTNEEIDIEQLRARGHGFVQKPFGAEELTRKIRELCDRRPRL